MKLKYERRIQSVADRLEEAHGAYGLEKLDLSQVLQAVESLEDDGLSLDRIVEREDLVAERIHRERSAAPSAPQ